MGETELLNELRLKKGLLSKLTPVKDGKQWRSLFRECNKLKQRINILHRSKNKVV